MKISNFDFVPTISEYKKRVEENFKLYEKNEFRFWEYLFFDLKEGKSSNPHSDVLSKSINDIRGSIPLGQLAIFAQTGEDAYKLENGKYVATELKTIELDEDRIVIGKNNDLYYKLGINLVNLKDAIKIGFVISNEALRKTKNRPTYLILRRKSDGHVIDAFYLDGDIIYSELLKGDLNISAKSIHLKVFLEKGSLTKVYIPHIGWENWLKEMRDTKPYLIRLPLIEDFQKQCSKERRIIRKTISQDNEEIDFLKSKISRYNLIRSKNFTLIKKEFKRIKSINEQIEKLQERKKELNEKVQIRKSRFDKITVYLNELTRTLDLIEKIKFIKKCFINFKTNKEEKTIEDINKLKKTLILEKFYENEES